MRPKMITHNKRSNQRPAVDKAKSRLQDTKLLTPNGRPPTWDASKSLESTFDKAEEAMASKLSGVMGKGDGAIFAQEIEKVLDRAVADGKLSVGELVSLTASLAAAIQEAFKDINEVAQTVVDEGARSETNAKASMFAAEQVRADLIGRGLLPSKDSITDIGHGALFVGDVRLDLLSTVLSLVLMRNARVASPALGKASLLDRLIGSQRSLSHMEELGTFYPFDVGIDDGPITLELRAPGHVTHLEFVVPQSENGALAVSKRVPLEDFGLELGKDQTITMRFAAPNGPGSPISATIGQRTFTVMDPSRYGVKVWAIGKMALTIDFKGVASMATVVAGAAIKHPAGQLATLFTPVLEQLMGSPTTALFGQNEEAKDVTGSTTPGSLSLTRLINPPTAARRTPGAVSSS